MQLTNCSIVGDNLYLSSMLKLVMIEILSERTTEELKIFFISTPYFWAGFNDFNGLSFHDFLVSSFHPS